MPNVFTDYDVFGLYGIFLMDHKAKKKIMGTVGKRVKLMEATNTNFSSKFLEELAEAGFTTVKRYAHSKHHPLLACWVCEIPVTDWKETDDPKSIHRLLSPFCPLVQDDKKKCSLV